MAEGQSWFGEPGPGELVDWEPVLDRAGVSVAPHRVAAAYLELAVLVRALEGLASTVRWQSSDRRRARSGRACSTCARTCSAARSTISARSPPDTAHVVELTVVGSINLDLVARVERLPRPGETLSASGFERIPGGKGANQAVAAARLGAQVRLVGAVGDDSLADRGARRPRRGGGGARADPDRRHRPGDDPRRRRRREPDRRRPGRERRTSNRGASAERCCASSRCRTQVVLEAARDATFFALNACAGAPDRRSIPDLLIVNRLEHEVVSAGKLVAVTFGAAGAALYEDGREVARALPPAVDAVDGTAAGDAFAACLVVSLLEGRVARPMRSSAHARQVRWPHRDSGAQPSLPTRAELDAILAS